MPYNISRPLLTPTKLIILAALFMAVTGNAAFFDQVTDIYPWGRDYFWFLGSVGIVLACALMLLMSLLSVLMPTRIVVSVFILLAAAIGFFSDQFGTVVDSAMLQNILETDTAEAGDLLRGGFILHFLVLGIFPVTALWLLPMARASHGRELGYRAQTAVAAVLIAAACLYSFSDLYTGFFRQHRSLRYYTNPAYALYSMGKLVAETNSVEAAPGLVQVAPEARLPLDDPGHELIIMVVGETARRDRFALNGYTRNTNPELAKESNIISYTNISACGTSTSISVPCMFSFLGRENFSSKEAATTENVLDVLQRAGVSILWRDNNSSSKGVADRVPYEDFRSPAINPVCDRECRDVGMLDGLQEFIDAQNTDILIVLHSMGNHGPAYFKRYPPEFERFKPACQSEELADCSKVELDNAYDNAILYTDYFLARVIALLKANTPKFETAMLYVSDHGESLGENGLYLHGLPYVLAPPEQTDVPVIVWIGDSSDIDISSALNLKDAPNSHDAVAQSLLSLFEIESDLIFSSPALFELGEENRGAGTDKPQKN